MKLSVLKENLLDGLNKVSKATSKSISLPILNNVLLSTEKSFLKLSATDLELGIKYWTLAKIAKEGALALPARFLTDLVNLVSGEREVIALWGNACNQGRTAGLNMAGRRSFYLGSMPQYVNTFFGMTFISIGDLRERGDDVQISFCKDEIRKCCRLFLFKKGILLGVNTVNCFQEIGYMKAAISQRLKWQTLQGPGIERPLWLRETAIPRSCAAACEAIIPVNGLPRSLNGGG